MLSRSLLRRIAFLWTMIIVIASFLPVRVKEVIGTETSSRAQAARNHAAVRHATGHIIGFGMASLLFAAASTKKTQRLNYCLFLAALGTTIELIQHAFMGAVFEWWDIRDDTLAVIVGCLVGSLLALSVLVNRETSHSTYEPVH